MSKHSIKTKGKILTFNPTGEYYFSKGIKAYHRKDLYKAKKFMERAMVLEPEEPMIVCQLAIILTDLGEYKQSNQLLHTVLDKMDENMAECHYFLANNYAYLGHFKEAYLHAKSYLNLHPEGSFTEDAEDLLDVISLEEDDMEEDFFDQDDLITKQEEARSLLELGKFKEAIHLLTDVIEEFPEYWSAYNNLALAHFYLGEVEKANNILTDVLSKNPGNLHALCNRLVFAYYLKDFKSAKKLKEALKKVKPILLEHQYKLGATFALVGEYELAFAWLRKLQRHGYDGDGAFYYWLSYSSYHIGNENFAKSIWKKVIELNPEKNGLEPWNTEATKMKGFEDDLQLIRKRLESDYIEERLFALFLTAVSNNKQEIIKSDWFINNQRLTALEKEYRKAVENQDIQSNEALYKAHEAAKELYSFHHPIGTSEAGLILMWFTIFVELTQEHMDIKNSKAMAAATEYMWRKLKDDGSSQQVVAKQYGISASTLQKYVKLVNKYLH